MGCGTDALKKKRERDRDAPHKIGSSQDAAIMNRWRSISTKERGLMES